MNYKEFFSELEFSDLFSLKGKVALITGGAGGMGSFFSFAYAQFGADVIVADIITKETDELKQVIEDLGRRCVVKKVDVTDEKAIKELMKEIKSQFGKLDILLHTVGQTFRKPAVETSVEEWNKILNMNLTSTFICNKAAAKLMFPEKRGKIINISSCGSFFCIPERTAYNVAKAGVNQLTKILALEWAKYNINVNAIIPGLTEHFRNTNDPVFQQGDRRKNAVNKIPMGRLGTPSDLVGAAIFLASKASNWVTGQSIPVEGGRLISDY